MTALTDLDASQAVAALRAGEILCEDYARALLDRAQSLAHLNAFRTLDRERVLESARRADKARAEGKTLGRLHGLPIPVKDSVNTRELPTSNGTRALRDFRPKEDAAVLKPLLAEGALVMGKTNLHELSRGWTSNNGAFGAILNPYDPGRIPGGSSGGSAVAVAARMAPLAIAEDTLGSIRVPATLCGVVGLRPTFGRYPGAGIMPLTFDRFDQAGPLARCVADVALFDEIVTGDSAALPPRALAGVRLGMSEFLWSGLDAEVERVALDAMGRLEAAGAILVRAEIPEVAKDAYNVARQIIGTENVASIAAFLEEQGAGVTFAEALAAASPNLRETYRLEFKREDYEEALRKQAAIKAQLAAHLAGEDLDALLFPPVLAPALALGDNSEVDLRGEKVPLRWVMARNTALASCAGLPSLTLPAGLTHAGLPVGVELLGRHGSDRALLALGLAVERAWGRLAAPKLAA
jgi:mandelamide amidase